MISFLLIINLIIALWVFYDAQKRGFTFWESFLWAVGVFSLLIIFLPLYLIVRRRKILTAREEQTFSSLMKVCFYCGEPYRGDPESCPNCGQNLKPL